MFPNRTALLIPCKAEGYGEPISLVPDASFSLGRALSCDIVVRDDLCSRKHAEISHTNDGWQIADLKSLNGVYVNEVRLIAPWILGRRDEIRIGRSIFHFVYEMSELPSMPDSGTLCDDANDLTITRRSERSRFIPATTNEHTAGMPAYAEIPQRLSNVKAIERLYRLVMEMGTANNVEELADLALDAILNATPAEGAAVLLAAQNDSLHPLSIRTRTGDTKKYQKPLHFVMREVATTGQAVLAEEPKPDPDTEKTPKITQEHVSSLIVAPLRMEGEIQAYLHLFSLSGRSRLSPDDLEFAIAVARQFSTVWKQEMEKSGLIVENQNLKNQLQIESEIIGESKAIQQLQECITRVASTRATIFIRGESGVGKELVARAIHSQSPRRDRPMFILNCAAIPESLLERELFGHEKGAYTGANERGIGKFEAADRGTIFLDEIGEMSPMMQAKLLRILDSQPFERVGGNTSVKVDVRVVAATNRPIEEFVQEGRFRKDLYYRLQVVQIDVPALRDHRDDIPLLAEHFLLRFSRETGRAARGFTAAAIRKMKEYSWPGNVRELRNAIERAVALGSHTAKLDENDILLLQLPTGTTSSAEYAPVSIEAIEKEHILRTLEHTQWHKSRAAEILGIERSTLDRKLKTYGINKPE